MKFKNTKKKSWFGTPDKFWKVVCLYWYWYCSICALSPYLMFTVETYEHVSYIEILESYTVFWNCFKKNDHIKTQSLVNGKLNRNFVKLQPKLKPQRYPVFAQLDQCLFRRAILIKENKGLHNCYRYFVVAEKCKW